MIELTGTFNVLFSKETDYVTVTILATVRDSRGHILYFEGEDSIIYNWSAIVIMQKVK